KRLTIEDIYDPEKKVDFTGTPPAKLTWLDDTHYLWPKADAKGKTTALLKVEAATGRTEALFDAERMEAVLAKLPGVKPEEARDLSRQDSYTMNPARTA